MRVKAVLALVVASVLFGSGRAGANPIDRGSSVVVVYNTKVKESEDVARHYASRRFVPKVNVIGLALPVSEEITREQFSKELQGPLLAELEKRKLMNYEGARVTSSKLRYLTLCYGVPLKIKRDPTLREGLDNLPPQLRGMNEASVDSELAWLPRLKGAGVPLNGPVANVFYDSKRIFDFHATNGILMVARLDGPSPTLAKGLVDSAIFAETNGFWGRAYIDGRGIKSGDLAQGDEWIHNAGKAAISYGLDTIIDDEGETFGNGFPMSHVAVYAGWYSQSVTGPFLEKKVEFMPGAIAYHLHSFSATTLRYEEKNWVGPMIAQGAAATMGSVYEPYLDGMPDVGIFVDRMLLQGFSLGEAAYAAQKSVSWMTTVVGDPMYRPCARLPQALHEDLQARKRSEIEWSLLRVVNLNIGKGVAATNMVNYLGGIPFAKKSAVLLEKLGDLYDGLGQRVNAARAWGMALRHPQSTQQHKRLLLKAARRLAEIKRIDDARKVYDLFIKKFPKYPDLAKVRGELAKL